MATRNRGLRGWEGYRHWSLALRVLFILFQGRLSASADAPNASAVGFIFNCSVSDLGEIRFPPMSRRAGRRSKGIIDTMEDMLEKSEEQQSAGQKAEMEAAHLPFPQKFLNLWSAQARETFRL